MSSIIRLSSDSITARLPSRSLDRVTNSHASRFFSGTQEKCVACKKTVYTIVKVAVNGTPYHKPCFRWSPGGCLISPSNYVTHEHRLYCKHPHNQLFKVEGNFSELDKDTKIEVVSKVEEVPMSEPAATA